jgi:hypothetical protein
VQIFGAKRFLGFLSVEGGVFFFSKYVEDELCRAMGASGNSSRAISNILDDKVRAYA